MTTYRDLKPVFFGSINEATVLRAFLDAQGYESFIADENTKVVDPVITGANSFDVRLVVPADDAEAVTALLRDIREGREGERPSPAVRRGWRILTLILLGPSVVYILFRILGFLD